MQILFKLKDGKRPCLDDVSIKKHLPLCGKLYYQITHLYSGLEAIKASKRGGVPLSRRHIIADTTAPVCEKNKKRSRPLQPIVNSRHSSFSCQKICCALSVQSTSSVQAEVAILWLRKKPFPHYIQHLHNILSGQGLACWLMNISL